MARPTTIPKVRVWPQFPMVLLSVYSMFHTMLYHLIPHVGLYLRSVKNKSVQFPCSHMIFGYSLGTFFGGLSP